MSYIGIGLPLHFGSGDNTQALGIFRQLLPGERPGGHRSDYIPVEWFQESDATMDKRHVYWPYTIPGRPR